MKILIATDGSEFSKAAIEKCCQIIARPQRTEIKIISVFEGSYPFVAEPFAVSAEYVQEMETIARKQSQSYIAGAEKQIRDCLPDQTVEISGAIGKGSPDQRIIEEAESWGADLIVVGSHGRGFWGRMFLGSVSQSVVQHAPCSVLVVRNS